MDIHNAIFNLYPSVANINGDSDARDSDGNKVELDQDLIYIEIKRLENEYNSQEYARNRQGAYPSIPDQLDDIYHNGLEGWRNTIKNIKDKFPKPNG